MVSRVRGTRLRRRPRWLVSTPLIPPDGARDGQKGRRRARGTRSGLTRPTYRPRTCFLFHVHSVQYYGVLRALSFWHTPTPAPTRESRGLGGGPPAVQRHLISTNFPPSRFLVRRSATTRMRALDGPGLGYARRARCLPTNLDHGMCTIRARLAGLHTIRRLVVVYTA